MGLGRFAESCAFQTDHGQNNIKQKIEETPMYTIYIIRQGDSLNDTL